MFNNAQQFLALEAIKKKKICKYPGLDVQYCSMFSEFSTLHTIFENLHFYSVAIKNSVLLIAYS